MDGLRMMYWKPVLLGDVRQPRRRDAATKRRARGAPLNGRVSVLDLHARHEQVAALQHKERLQAALSVWWVLAGTACMRALRLALSWTSSCELRGQSTKMVTIQNTLVLRSRRRRSSELAPGRHSTDAVHVLKHNLPTQRAVEVKHAIQHEERGLRGRAVTPAHIAHAVRTWSSVMNTMLPEKRLFDSDEVTLCDTCAQPSPVGARSPRLRRGGHLLVGEEDEQQRAQLEQE
jgi:hypothetical protein